MCVIYVMDRIILFWCFKNINFWGRILEFRVQFWYPSDWRLWRTDCVIYVKIDWWNSNAHCFWERLHIKIKKIIDPSTPQNHLLLDISMRDTLYVSTNENVTLQILYLPCANCITIVSNKSLQNMPLKRDAIFSNIFCNSWFSIKFSVICRT